MTLHKHTEAAPGFTLVEIMIVVAIIGLLVSMAIPNFIKMRTDAQRKACIANLRIIDHAKQTWALENRKGNGDVVTPADIIGPTMYVKEMPKCPAGGAGADYDLTNVGIPPTCNIPGHLLP